MSEQLYRFIDKSGKCFNAFANIQDNTEYHKMVADLLTASHEGKKTFTVGDALCFRDELQEEGFVWGDDFYMQKV